jgi:hypothetical protein
MKNFLNILFLFFFFKVNSQITFTEKDEKDSMNRNQAYVFLNQTNSFRSLIPNEDFIPGNLGEKKYEKVLKTYSFGLGLKGFLHKNVIWDAGLMYLQNGEQYEFNSITSDSSFSYQNYYKYIAMPVKINFTVGHKVRVFGGVGLVPQLFLNYRQNQQWETTLGSRESNKIESKDGFNTFIASVAYNLGISLHSKNGYGLFISGDYRAQIQNGFNKLSYFKHKSSGTGFSIGITKEI